MYHLCGAAAAARAAGCSAACCCSPCPSHGSPLTAEFHHACVTLQASGTAPDGCHAGGAPDSGCGCGGSGGCGGFGRLTFLATPGSLAAAALVTAEPRVGGAASATSTLSCGAGERRTTWERAALALPLRPSVACSSSGSPEATLPSSVSGISPPRLAAAAKLRVAFRAAERRQRRSKQLRQAPTATPVPSVLPVSAALVDGVTYTATGGKGDGDGGGDGLTACRTGCGPLRETPASGAGGGVAAAGGGELLIAAQTLVLQRDPARLWGPLLFSPGSNTPRARLKLPTKLPLHSRLACALYGRTQQPRRARATRESPALRVQRDRAPRALPAARAATPRQGDAACPRAQQPPGGWPLLCSSPGLGPRCRSWRLCPSSFPRARRVPPPASPVPLPAPARAAPPAAMCCAGAARSAHRPRPRRAGLLLRPGLSSASPRLC
jgi:hypothetical protein